MATNNVPRTINDAVDEFTLKKMNVASLMHLITDVMEEIQGKDVNEPWSQVQKIHACASAALEKLEAMERIVCGMPALAKA